MLMYMHRPEQVKANGKIIREEWGLKPLSRKHLRALCPMRPGGTTARALLEHGHDPARGTRGRSRRVKTVISAWDGGAVCKPRKIEVKPYRAAPPDDVSIFDLHAAMQVAGVR